MEACLIMSTTTNPSAITLDKLNGYAPLSSPSYLSPSTFSSKIEKEEEIKNIDSDSYLLEEHSLQYISKILKSIL